MNDNIETRTGQALLVPGTRVMVVRNVRILQCFPQGRSAKTVHQYLHLLLGKICPPHLGFWGPWEWLLLEKKCPFHYGMVCFEGSSKLTRDFSTYFRIYVHEDKCVSARHSTLPLGNTTRRHIRFSHVNVLCAISVDL